MDYFTPSFSLWLPFLQLLSTLVHDPFFCTQLLLCVAWYGPAFGCHHCSIFCVLRFYLHDNTGVVSYFHQFGRFWAVSRTTSGGRRGSPVSEVLPYLTARGSGRLCLLVLDHSIHYVTCKGRNMASFLIKAVSENAAVPQHKWTNTFLIVEKASRIYLQ